MSKSYRVKHVLRTSQVLTGRSSGLLSVALSIGFTRTQSPGRWLTAQPLAGILPCGARTFLTPLRVRDRAPFRAKL